jgi:hypothetical protein
MHDARCGRGLRVARARSGHGREGDGEARDRVAHHGWSTPAASSAGDHRREGDAVVPEDGHAAVLKPADHPAHREEGRHRRDDKADADARRPVGGKHHRAALEELVPRGRAQRDEPQEEAKLHRRDHLQAHREAAQDGGERARRAGPHGHALGQADEHGHARGERVEGHTRPTVTQPLVHRQNHHAAHKPRRHDGPQTKQHPLDALLEEQPQHCCGHEGREHVEGHRAPRPVAPHQAEQHRLNAPRKHAQHRGDGPGLDADDVGPRGLVLRDVQEPLGEQEVPGGAHRQILGQSLNEPQDGRLHEVHRHPQGRYLHYNGLGNDRMP